MVVPLLLFAGLQLARQDEGAGANNADDPIENMSTNEILGKLFTEIEGNEPRGTMFSPSTSSSSSPIPAKLEARGGAGGGGRYERPGAPSSLGRRGPPPKEEDRKRRPRPLPHAAGACTASWRPRAGCFFFFVGCG